MAASIDWGSFLLGIIYHKSLLIGVQSWVPPIFSSSHLGTWQSNPQTWPEGILYEDLKHGHLFGSWLRRALSWASDGGPISRRYSTDT